MRKLVYLVISVLFFTACEKDKDDPVIVFESKTVSMGNNSINDVYYSLANGEVKSVNRTDWDIAFSTALRTATILINEGAGVELYCVGDTMDWEMVNETSMANVEQRFNDKSDWATGAFNINNKGFPNYGWGTYHGGQPDHHVGADSIYIIRLTDGSYKKFMVRVKLSSNINIIRIDDLNASNEEILTVPLSSYVNTKHFIHYSLVDRAIVEAEPDKSEWDLLFTRYVVKIPTGLQSFMNYPVMGILTNPDVLSAKVTDVDVEKANEPAEYSDAADIIGYDWKLSDPVTHEISLVDSTGYFIQSVDDKTYQLYFTEYGGNSAGTIGFKIRTVE